MPQLTTHRTPSPAQPDKPSPATYPASLGIARQTNHAAVKHRNRRQATATSAKKKKPLSRSRSTIAQHNVDENILLARKRTPGMPPPQENPPNTNASSATATQPHNRPERTRARHRFSRQRQKQFSLGTQTHTQHDSPFPYCVFRSATVPALLSQTPKAPFAPPINAAPTAPNRRLNSNCFGTLAARPTTHAAQSSGGILRVLHSFSLSVPYTLASAS